jgi:23S rRNA (uracil1939-C5)-methyltransferase
MAIITLKLTAMAHGGLALGRDESKRVIFVPFALPGERVRVELGQDADGKRFAHARLLEVLSPSPQRVSPRCAHFPLCGHSHYQHIAYPAQLEHKQAMVRDQLERVGGFKNAPVAATLANPEPWAAWSDVTLYPAPGGGLGFWSAGAGAVTPIESCPLLAPILNELLQDMELALPGLRKVTLRAGAGDELLAALEINDVEPPELEADFPISVAMVLPDGSAANLIGDNDIVRLVKGRNFHISAGSFFFPSLAATALVVDEVLRQAELTGQENVVELFAGVGLLTAFLSQQAQSVVALEANADSVADMVTNLDDRDNVTVYEGAIAGLLPAIGLKPDLVVVTPPEDGLPGEVVAEMARLGAPRLIYVSADPADLARSGQKLAHAGYRLSHVQPIDMYPQTFQALTVALWRRRNK